MAVDAYDRLIELYNQEMYTVRLEYDLDGRKKTKEVERAGLSPITDDDLDQAAKYMHKSYNDFREAQNPRERELLSDTINNSEMYLWGLFHRRMAKIIELASLNGLDNGQLSTDNMTKNEKSLYYELKDRFKIEYDLFKERMFKGALWK
jgi:DNA replication initiation complex subunit (GINS family)